MTYGEIYEELCSVVTANILDYRPCVELYDVPNIPNAIVAWLSNGAKMIYIAKENLHMRDATNEELESVNNYCASISKETDVNFYDLM